DARVARHVKRVKSAELVRPVLHADACAPLQADETRFTCCRVEDEAFRWTEDDSPVMQMPSRCLAGKHGGGSTFPGGSIPDDTVFEVQAAHDVTIVFAARHPASALSIGDG